MAFKRTTQRRRGGAATTFDGSSRLKAATDKSVTATIEAIRARLVAFAGKDLPAKVRAHAPSPVASSPAERKHGSGAQAKPASRGKSTGAIVAVFDIEDGSKRFSKITLDQLTDYLAAQLSDLGYRVVPREQIRQRLMHEKRDTYKACYDQSCQVELGRELAAEKSISTKLLRVADKCAVTAVMFDLRTATAERSAPLDTPCDEGSLMDAVKGIARKLRP
jgi:hypothetical protein